MWLFIHDLIEVWAVEVGERTSNFSHTPLRWRHNGCDSVSNHQPRECLLRRLITRTSKKTSKLRVTGLCAGNSPETGEFPAQMASNAENVSIWWRHHVNCAHSSMLGRNLIHVMYRWMGSTLTDWYLPDIRKRMAIGPSSIMSKSWGNLRENI